MGEAIEFRYGDVRLAIQAVRKRIENPKPVLKELGRKMSSDIKANIARGGSGWPPYAKSTKKRLESTGTSQVTVRGTIRTDRVKRTMKAMIRVQEQLRKRGTNPQLMERLQKLQKRLQNYRKAEERAADKGLGKAGIGPRQSEGRRLLKNMPGTIRAKLIDNGRTLYVYSAAGKIGAIHNEGAGKTPKREFIPPPNMAENMSYFKTLVESDLGQAWEKGKGR